MRAFDGGDDEAYDITMIIVVIIIIMIIKINTTTIINITIQSIRTILSSSA